MLGSVSADAPRILSVARTLSRVMLVHGELQLILSLRRIEHRALFSALCKLIFHDFQLHLLILDSLLALRRFLWLKRSNRLGGADASPHRVQFVLKLALTIHLRAYLLRFLYALHVASNLRLHSRIGLEWALAALSIGSGTHSNICDGSANDLSFLVLINVVLGGTLSLLHQAHALLKRNTLLHRGLGDRRFCR